MSVTELDRVREVLLGSEYNALLALRNEYRDDDKFAAHVAAVVSEALQQRTLQDDSIASVLAPLIDQAIAASINQDPRKLAESLYPIMGPAIRKSISETLQQMLENLNQLLEQSLSPRSLRWRFDAWRSGRRYSEIVLLNTLDYQVEQVFLIHRETSLLLQHVYADRAELKDADMVSGMLSAIQDFIEDSFSVSEGDVLDTLKLGELTVLVQRGPLAILAAAVRGRLPDTLRTRMQGTLEKVHRVKRPMLRDYAGDPEGFADLQPELVALLDLKVKSRGEGGRRPTPWLALFAVAALFLLGAYFQYESLRVKSAMDLYAHAVSELPGIVVLHSEENDGLLSMEVLRDADALPVQSIEYDATLFRPAVSERSHISLDPGIVERRAARILAPPAGVSLSVEDRELVVAGKATVDWYTQLQQRWPAVAGIEAADTSALQVFDPRAEALEAARLSVESRVFRFGNQQTLIDPQDPALDDLAADIRRVLELADAAGYRASLDIVGYTDESGSRPINRRLALARADALAAELGKRGIAPGVQLTHTAFDYDGVAVSNERKVLIHVRLER